MSRERDGPPVGGANALGYASLIGFGVNVASIVLEAVPEVVAHSTALPASAVHNLGEPFASPWHKARQRSRARGT